MKDVIYFHVQLFKPLYSDCHSKISLSLKASFQPKTFLKTGEKMSPQFKRSKYSTEKFKRALRNQEIVSQISSFLSTQFDTDDDGIDSACSKFEELLLVLLNKV